MIEANVLRRWLEVFTLAYLAFPLLLFAVGWLQAPYAVALILVVSVALVTHARTSFRGDSKDGFRGESISLRRLASSLLPVVALTLVSGTGGWGFKDSDWRKHDAILKDLIEHPWPVIYTTPGDGAALVYYLAYYLPAGAVGKVGGWSAANQVLCLTTLLGASMAALWVAVLTRGPAIWKVAAFGLFSGMDVIGIAIVSLQHGLVPWRMRGLSINHLEWWAGWWQYSSHTTLLFWVPQHAIAGWLATALYLAANERRDPRLPFLLILALSFCWSPFVTIGLFPFVPISWRGSLQEWLRSVATTANLAGLVVLAVLACYYASRFVPYSAGPESVANWPRIPPESFGPIVEVRDGNPDGSFAFLPFVERRNAPEFFVHYLLFCTLEFLGLSVAIALAVWNRNDTSLRCLVAATLTLLVLPFFRYGMFNDLVMRAAIPSLFVMAVLAIRVVDARRSIPKIAIVVVTLLSVGLVNPLNELRRHLKNARGIYHLERIESIESVEPNLGTSPVLMRQYLGSPEAPFFRYAARQGRKR